MAHSGTAPLPPFVKIEWVSRKTGPHPSLPSPEALKGQASQSQGALLHFLTSPPPVPRQQARDLGYHEAIAG
eukprot:scaffold7504_cov277-Pinguiococcus_pyrenoidosus.AAC.5